MFARSKNLKTNGFAFLIGDKWFVDVIRKPKTRKNIEKFPEENLYKAGENPVVRKELKLPLPTEEELNIIFSHLELQERPQNLLNWLEENDMWIIRTV